jgi:hypothetical protein
MTDHTPSSKLSRPEVVSTGARRRWTLEEKQRLVAESYEGPRLVSLTARRNGNPITNVTVSAGINASNARTAKSTTRGAEVATQGMTAGLLIAIMVDRRAVKTFRTLQVAAMIVLASAQAHSGRA